MQSLALFDLDDTLVDRSAAFQAWAEEFVVTHGLGEAALTFLLMADAHHSGPRRMVYLRRGRHPQARPRNLPPRR